MNESVSETEMQRKRKRENEIQRVKLKYKEICEKIIRISEELTQSHVKIRAPKQAKNKQTE